MSFFGFFRKSKDTAAASASAAKADNITVIDKLRDQSEMLDKRNNYNVTRIEKLTLEIKGKLSSGDKKGAMLLLQQKKKLDAEIEQHQGTQLLLQNQLSALECATLNKDVVDALSLGNATIKRLTKDIPVTRIDDLMEDIHEMQDAQAQIQNAMSAPLHQLYDDPDLLAELQEMEADVAEAHAQTQAHAHADQENVLNLPSVPTKMPHSAKAAAEDEDEIMHELRLLEQSMLVSN
jgi:hypothetical protein